VHELWRRAAVFTSTIQDLRYQTMTIIVTKARTIAIKKICLKLAAADEVVALFVELPAVVDAPELDAPEVDVVVVDAPEVDVVVIDALEVDVVVAPVLVVIEVLVVADAPEVVDGPEVDVPVVTDGKSHDSVPGTVSYWTAS